MMKKLKALQDHVANCEECSEGMGIFGQLFVSAMCDPGIDLFFDYIEDPTEAVAAIMGEPITDVLQ